jgi:hypothetical protein
MCKAWGGEAFGDGGEASAVARVEIRESRRMKI